jgi:hypothetical protein
MQLRFCGQVFKAIFVPKGLQDSAGVLTPGTDKQGGALLSMCPGVETPGSVL